MFPILVLILDFSILLQMRLTWISGDSKPQYVHYGDGKLSLSTVETFTPNDLCGRYHEFYIESICDIFKEARKLCYPNSCAYNELT